MVEQTNYWVLNSWAEAELGHKPNKLPLGPIPRTGENVIKKILYIYFSISTRNILQQTKSGSITLALILLV